MPGLVIAILLIASLLLVHFSMQTRPMPARHPLDVDQNLPLPEIGQASTVFSLTALFGAYFGIYIILGLPALGGVACGTVLGLFIIRHWIHKQQPGTFEEFLQNILQGSGLNGEVFALFTAVTQGAYAVSELLILRELSRIALGLRSDHATILAISTGIIGYFYVLFGGYLAVYRTDILQFLLVAIMTAAFGIYFLATGIAAKLGNITWPIWPRPGYWELPLAGAVPASWEYLYHFAIGIIMGLGLLAAAPDAWKRVFVVTTLRRNTLSRFAIFVCVGIAPFIVLLPLGLFISPIPDGPINARQMFAGFPANNALFIAASLGLIACFLSSFNSALLASVHVSLMVRRKMHPLATTEFPRFHRLMASVLVAISLLFLSLSSFENPYLLGNLLLGPYAIIAGMQVGTDATPGRLPGNTVLFIAVIGFVGWFIYFVSGAVPTVPTTYEINTVPAGVLMFLLIVVICRVLLRLRGSHA